MGTINYGKSDYITLGIKPYDAWELLKDEYFIEYLKHDLNIDPESDQAQYVAYEVIEEYYNADRVNFETALNKYDIGYFFHITLKPGYYEGYYVEIETNKGLFFDDCAEKREAQKEVTEIKKFLKEIASYGFIQVFPGWCTGYSDYQETLKGINEAVKEMREEIKSTPTWYMLHVAGEL